MNLYGILNILAIVLFAVGVNILHHKTQRPAQVGPDDPPPTRWGVVMYVVAIVFLGVCLIALFTAVAAGVSGGQVYFIASIGAAIIASRFLHHAREADKHYAESMKYRAEAKAAHVEYEQNQIRLENARVAAFEQGRLEAAQRDTQLRELELRRQLLDVGKETLLTPEAVVDVNVHAKKKSIDLQAQKVEAHQSLDAADRVDHYRIVSQLEQELDELLIKRREIEKTEEDEVLKEQRIDRLNKRIQTLELDIRERQKDRFLSAPNRKEIRGLQEEGTDD
jgi:hypothetical protein